MSDVIPAGLRSEATSRYIADVVNTWQRVQVLYRFPNGWAAHVRFAGCADGGEWWDVMPGLPNDDVDDDMTGELTHRNLSTWDVEHALLRIRDYRPLGSGVDAYIDDLCSWHASGGW